MAINPVILPPEVDSRSATTHKLVTPMSRRKFRQKVQWGYRVIQNLETIAYYTIPLYRRGVSRVNNQYNGTLTGYHQWVLLQIRRIWDKSKDTEHTASFVHQLEQGGAFNHSEFQKDWINHI